MANEFILPKQLNLLGYTFTVEKVMAKDWKYKDAIGYFEPSELKIYIRNGKKALMAHTFYHELTHAILSTMGHPLNDDEVFVDSFSGLLHQALASAVYK